MRARTLIPALVFLASLAAVPAFAQETVLQNDGFVDGQNVGFQGGFVAGEMAGSRFLPTGTGPWRLNRVLLLLGGSSATVTITLHVYNDAAGTNPPGTELFSGDYQLTGSDVALQEINLVADNVVVPGQFRVGIEFQHSGFPSVARDADGTINNTKNFIYSPSIPGWLPSNLFGLTGDWVIRAGVQPSGSTGGTPGAPHILSIADVGNDQGRQVRLRFSRSSQDSAGAPTPVVRYDIHRKVTPGVLAQTSRAAAPLSAQVDGWDFVGSVPATGDAVYSLVVPTLVDSNVVSGMRRSTFFVRAATGVPTNVVDSPADSGYSVDNLPPAPPAANPAQYSGGATHLSWNANGEPDLWYYALHRGSTPGFVPTPANRIATTSGLGTDDPGAPGSWYKLAAVDVNGNTGAFTAIAPAVTSVTPPNAATLALALDTPHPVRGRALRFRVTLADDHSARLTLLDVGGRRVAGVDLGTLGAGVHTVPLAAPSGAGLLLARLEQAGEVRTLRVVTLR